MNEPWSSAEWNISIIMPMLHVFWQEVIGIENVRIRVIFFLAVNFVLWNDNCRAKWYNVIARYWETNFKKLTKKNGFPIIHYIFLMHYHAQK
jgi:hypothetical protein